MTDIPIRNIMPELSLALEAATKAGKAVMDIYHTDFESDTKADDSPITKADLVSNEIIKEILGRSSHYILSEEDADDQSRLDEKTLWVVDPLDGTSDFIGKTGEFTVMIALVQDKRPVLGVINWPVGNTVYAAQKDGGAYKLSSSWEKISVSSISDVKASRAVGSRQHLSDREKESIKSLGISEFTGVGSSLKVCRISSGQADIYFTYTDKMSEWDSAASNCILTEAGGRLTDVNGDEITYNNKDVKHRNGILATNGILHNEIRAGL